MKNSILLAGTLCAVAFSGCGSDGSDAVSTLINTSAEVAGANCDSGGLKIETGADLSGDGILDADEVESTQYVCSGADGETGATGGDGSDGLGTLVVTTDEPAGANCAEGGQRVDFGVDDNEDGVLDAAEIDGTAFVCDGVTGTAGLQALVLQTPIAPGAECATGGVQIDSGIDTSADGVLDAGEITDTNIVCNGADGNDGLDSLITLTAEPAGANCDNGGTRIDSGLDTDGSGVLDAGEITDTGFACNAPAVLGATGLFAADGGLNGDTPGNLYSIDTTTGVATIIAPLTESYSALSIDPAGVLHGIVRGPTNNGDLVSIDTETAVATTIGATGIITYPDMAFGPGGELFGWTESGDDLVNIDPVTGVGTQITSPQGTAGSGLAIAADSTIFFSPQGNNLLTLDPVTSATLTTVAITGDTGQINSMTFVGDTLFAITKVNAPARTLVTIDTTTGVATAIGAIDGLPANADALAGR